MTYLTPERGKIKRKKSCWGLAVRLGACRGCIPKPKQIWNEALINSSSIWGCLLIISFISHGIIPIFDQFIIKHVEVKHCWIIQWNNDQALPRLRFTWLEAHLENKSWVCTLIHWSLLFKIQAVPDQKSSFLALFFSNTSGLVF